MDCQTYQEFKEKCPDAILLVREGDFYEVYGPDAVKASDALGIARFKVGTRPGYNGGLQHGFKVGDPFTGFPSWSLDYYLPRLISAGYRVSKWEWAPPRR